MNRRLVLASAMALALGAGQAAHAACKLQLLGTIPISFVNKQPMVDVTINGKPAHLRFMLQSEPVFWGSALKDYGLKEAVGYSLGVSSGAGGHADATGVQIHELKIGDFARKDGYYYILYGVQKDDEAGIYGNSLINGKNDVELDFEHNVVRLFNSDGCKDGEVVYWGGSYSVVERDRSGFLSFKLAGKTLKGSINPGNEVTFVTLGGARDAGVSLRAAGPLPMGMLAGGAIKPIEVSVANFSELVLGDETIKNAPLAVGDVFPHRGIDVGPGVVLGADFFRSHRVYISRQQKKVYFSYIGGSVFQDIYARLGVAATPAAAAPPPAPKP